MARCPPHAAPRPGPQRARVAVHICRVQVPHPRSLGGARGPYVGPTVTPQVPHCAHVVWPNFGDQGRYLINRAKTRDTVDQALVQ